MHFVAPSVNVFVKSDNKVMLSRRANTGWMDGKLCAPGGHVEAGETPISAMLREIEEELGVSVNPDHLEFLCVAARNKGTSRTSTNEYVGYEFIINDKDYDFKNTEPEKCSGLVWVELDNLPADIIPDFREIIDRAIIDNQKFLQIGY